MTFEDWMHHKGLSPSSVKKYSSAISGVMSTWAIDNQLISGPLTSLTSRSAFEEIASRIQDLAIYQERNERGHNMYSSALTKFAEYLAEGFASDLDTDIEAILNSNHDGITEKINLIKSRVGQGAFRQKLISYWNCCAVTGFRDTSLLVASHIKPWSASNSTERLNPFNGLLLVPNLDKAFDAGYLTFCSQGHIKISPQLSEPEKLGISPRMTVHLTPQHEPFMAFHRDNVFRAI